MAFDDNLGLTIDSAHNVCSEVRNANQIIRIQPSIVLSLNDFLRRIFSIDVWGIYNGIENTFAIQDIFDSLYLIVYRNWVKSYVDHSI